MRKVSEPAYLSFTAAFSKVSDKLGLPYTIKSTLICRRAVVRFWLFHRENLFPIAKYRTSKLGEIEVSFATDANSFDIYNINRILENTEKFISQSITSIEYKEIEAEIE